MKYVPATVLHAVRFEGPNPAVALRQAERTRREARRAWARGWHQRGCVLRRRVNKLLAAANFT